MHWFINLRLRSVYLTSGPDPDPRQRCNGISPIISVSVRLNCYITCCVCACPRENCGVRLVVFASPISDNAILPDQIVSTILHPRSMEGKGWVDRRREGWVDRRREGWVDRRMEGWVDRRREGWVDRRREGWVDRRREGWVDRRREGWVDRRREGWVDRRREEWVDRRREGWVDRRREGWVDRGWETLRRVAWKHQRMRTYTLYTSLMHANTHAHQSMHIIDMPDVQTRTHAHILARKHTDNII